MIQKIKALKKLNVFLDRRQKAELAVLGVLFVVEGILQLISISVLIPYMAQLMNMQELMENPYMKTISGWFGLKTRNQVAIFLTICVLLAFVIKSVFSYLVALQESKFVNRNRNRMSVRAMHHLLHKPYLYFLKTSTDQVQAMITNQIAKIYLLLEKMLRFMAELLNMLFIVAMIIVMDWKVAVIIGGLFAVTILLFQRLITPKVEALGKISDRYYKQMIRCIRQPVDGIREVKIMHSEAEFLERYKEVGTENAELDLKMTRYRSLPRNLMELILVSGVLIVVLVLFGGNGATNGDMVLLSVIAVALVRMLPGAYSINSLFTSVSYYLPTLEAVGQELFDVLEKEKQTEKEENTKLSFRDSVKFNGVSFAYPGKNEPVLDGLDFEIKQGEKVFLKGASGIGKTTLTDLFIGLLEPVSGEIAVDGQPMKQVARKWQGCIGYVPQKVLLFHDTIRENILLGRKGYTDDRIWEALEIAQIAEEVKKLPKGLDEVYGGEGLRFSGGQQQRLGIARGILGKPEVLILDEATAALDEETEREVLRQIFRMRDGLTILLISHRTSLSTYCDYTYQMKDGVCERVETGR